MCVLFVLFCFCFVGREEHADFFFFLTLFSQHFVCVLMLFLLFFAFWRGGVVQGGGISLDDGDGPDLMDIEVHMNTIDSSQVRAQDAWRL